jgi:hypothetical protein
VSRPSRRIALLAGLVPLVAGSLAGCAGGATPRATPSRPITTPNYSALETASPAPGATEQPNPYEFGPRIDNPWFPLWPGTRMQYVDHAGSASRTETVTVTRDTKMVSGVPTTVVRTQTRAHGRLLASGVGYYAQDIDGNVWLFGREGHASGGVRMPGTWLAGPHNVKPVIVMPAVPRPGSTYGGGEPTGWWATEPATGRSKVVSIGRSGQVPYGRARPVLQAVRVGDSSSRTYYAKGVGPVLAHIPGGSRWELVQTKAFD